MGRLAGISGEDAMKRFCRLGYRVVRQRGSHTRLHCPAQFRRKPITIPLHRELKIGLLRQLISDAGTIVEEFLEL